MIQAVRITQAQADQLQGVEYVPGAVFNPIQDAHDNWVVSMQELPYLPEDLSPKPEIIPYEPKPAHVTDI